MYKSILLHTGETRLTHSIFTPLFFFFFPQGYCIPFPANFLLYFSNLINTFPFLLGLIDS